MYPSVYSVCPLTAALSVNNSPGLNDGLQVRDLHHVCGSVLFCGTHPHLSMSVLPQRRGQWVPDRCCVSCELEHSPCCDTHPHIRLFLYHTYSSLFVPHIFISFLYHTYSSLFVPHTFISFCTTHSGVGSRLQICVPPKCGVLLSGRRGVVICRICPSGETLGKIIIG